MWFLTLLLGTCMLYSTRTTMPLLLPAVASELRWSKTESGTVLSSFFWGYTVTQVRWTNVIAGYMVIWRELESSFGRVLGGFVDLLGPSFQVIERFFERQNNFIDVDQFF